MSEKSLIYEKSVSGRVGYTLPATDKTESEILKRIVLYKINWEACWITYMFIMANNGNINELRSNFSNSISKFICGGKLAPNVKKFNKPVMLNIVEYLGTLSPEDVLKGGYTPKR